MNFNAILYSVKTSDIVNVIFPVSGLSALSPDSLTDDATSSKCMTSAMLLARNSCLQSTFWVLTAGSDVTISKSKLYTHQLQFHQKFAQTILGTRVNLFIYNWGIYNLKTTFFKSVLNGFWDYTRPCAFCTCTSSIIWEAVFPSSIRLTT